MDYKNQPQSRFTDSVRKAVVRVAEFAGWLTFVREDIVDAFLASRQRVPIRIKEHVGMKGKLIALWRFFWNSNYYWSAIVLAGVFVALLTFRISDPQQQKIVLAALKATPIPTILVIGGISFLLLSIAGQLAGRIAVSPERQRRAAVIGGGLLMIGVALHVAPQVNRPSIPPNIPTPTPTMPPALTPKPDAKPQPDLQSPKPSLQTQYPQVVAELTSFKQTGEFVTVELTLSNAGEKRDQFICPRGTTRPLKKEKKLEAKQVKLMDQATGENWGPSDYSGSLWYWCGSLAPGQSVGAWMTYKIPDPGKKTFSFSLPILNGSFYNLRLGQNPTPTPPATN